LERRAGVLPAPSCGTAACPSRRIWSWTGCKSAPKRDPRPNLHKPLIYQRYFLENGVPIGTDWDPHQAVVLWLISIPDADRRWGSGPMLLHIRGPGGLHRADTVECAEELFGSAAQRGSTPPVERARRHGRHRRYWRQSAMI
jgi:hypothetical protein